MSVRDIIDAELASLRRESEDTRAQLKEHDERINEMEHELTRRIAYVYGVVAVLGVVLSVAVITLTRIG